MITSAVTFLADATLFLAQATTTTTVPDNSALRVLGHGGFLGFVWTLLIGLVVGVIAKLLTPGRDPGGCIITSLIGIGGAFLAYIIGSAIGHYGPGEVPGFIASLIGAVLLLVIYHAVFKRGGGTPTV